MNPLLITDHYQIIAGNNNACATDRADGGSLVRRIVDGNVRGVLTRDNSWQDPGNPDADASPITRHRLRAMLENET